MLNALLWQVGRVLSAVGYENVCYSFAPCLPHFDRKMVPSKPLDITSFQGEVLTSYVTCDPLQSQEAFCV